MSRATKMICSWGVGAIEKILVDIQYVDMTPEEVEVLSAFVAYSVGCDPKRCLDQSITPFATARSLMQGTPPSRWRPWARARWLRRLRERTKSEMLQQCAFARQITGGEP